MPKVQTKKKTKVAARKVTTKRRRIKTIEDMRDGMREGTLDEDVYSEPGRAELLDADEISAEEDGFMKGYYGGEKTAKCARCGKPLLDDCVEKEISGEEYRFCSERCANVFEPDIE
jgi:hypothetical protein